MPGESCAKPEYAHLLGRADRSPQGQVFRIGHLGFVCEPRSCSPAPWRAIEAPVAALGLAEGKRLCGGGRCCRRAGQRLDIPGGGGVKFRRNKTP